MLARLLILVAIVAAACPAGVIVTADGNRFEGDIQRAGGGWKIVSAGGKSTFVATADVRSIELSGNSGNPASADEGLQSLRRSVEATNDVPKIIDRYRNFIDHAADAPTVAAAKQDLAAWQDRLDRHLIKVGHQWITADEKASLDAATSLAAQNARLLIKAGEMKEAGALLEAASQNDGGNISVLYLQGVLAESRADLQASKKAFTAVQAVAPDHAPTLLNLSVIAMRQKQWGPACALLTQAMLAAPSTMPLIDAAAELLAALPEDQRKSSAAVKLAKVFGDQDQKLQKVMAAKKMYRWGSTWVDQAAMDKLAAAEAAAKKKVIDLQGDFDLTQGRIQRIDTESAENDRAMRDMESHSWVPMADGTYVRAPLPSAYFDLQKRNNQLHGERIEMVSRLAALRDAAKHAKDDLPTPKFAGKIAIIGEDGMPVIAARPVVQPQPATAPATAPAASPPYIRIGPADNAD